MEPIILNKTLTGLAGEYFAAAELTRRNFAVTVTMSNTKAIDLLAEKDGKLFMFQVKSIQRNASISFNLKRDSIKEKCFYIFVNLNADTLETPDYFIMTDIEIREHLKLAASGRDWIDVNFLKKGKFGNRWDIIK